MEIRNDPAISIIMPIYNSVQYVDRSIQSVLSQTFTSFELILIDDGSTDGSGLLCDKYADDERVVVIHQENLGVCAARNVGIRKSRGKYICFIDNDDEYEMDYCKVLFNMAERTDADMVKCGRKNIVVSRDGREFSSRIKTYGMNICYDKNEFRDSYIKIKKSEIFTSIWNGLYRASVIQAAGLLFNESVKNGNEDLLFNYECIQICDRIAIVSDALYKHYYRDGHSTSLNFKENQVSSRLKAIKEELKIAKNMDDQRFIKTEGIRECFRILSFSDKKQIRATYSKEIESELPWEDNSTLYIIKERRFSVKEKAELLMLRMKIYKMYFLVRRYRKELMYK